MVMTLFFGWGNFFLGGGPSWQSICKASPNVCTACPWLYDIAAVIFRGMIFRQCDWLGFFTGCFRCLVSLTVLYVPAF